MSVFNQLPRIYQIAMLQGARVEVQYDGRWVNILTMLGITRRTPYRVVEKDLNIFEIAKQQATESYTIVEYEGYDYMLPKNALSPGEIIIMEYGMGVYVQVQEDLSLKDLEREHAEEILKKNEQIAYYSKSYDEFYGVEEEK